MGTAAAMHTRAMRGLKKPMTTSPQTRAESMIAGPMTASSTRLTIMALSW